MLNLSQSKTRAGLRLGVEMEHFITNNFILGLVYIYTYFSSLHLNGLAPTNGAYDIELSPVIDVWSIDDGLRSRASATSISNQTVMATLTYYFHALA